MPDAIELCLFVPRSFGAAVAAGVVARWPGLPDGRPLSFSPGAATTEAQARESRALLARHLGIDVVDLVFARQVHGTRIVRVERGIPPGEADGLLSCQAGLALCLSVADCCAVLVHDPARGCVGAFHAGWRGARDRIAVEGVREMARAFGANPGELLVYLSPCASVERYEVREDVARLFPRSVRSVPGDGGTRLHLDLRGEIARQLVEAGVPATAIESSPACTIADCRLHSHRRDGAASGRMAAFLLIRPSGAR